MSMVFDVSEEDVLAVALAAGKPLSDERACEILAHLDQGLVEQAALHFDDTDEQLNSAYDEIRRQVVDLGYGEEVLGVAPSFSKPRLT